MAKNDFSHEVAQNGADKCFCILVLDTSGSMYGEPITELNNGLKQFQSDILNDTDALTKLEVSIITFGSTVQQIQAPAAIDRFEMPHLTANGTTPMISAIDEAIVLAEDRKNWYKDQGLGYYRPWIVLMTDGEPDEISEVSDMAAKLRDLSAGKKINFTAIGIGDDVNMEVLGELSPNPARLKDMNFSGFFRWLSNSIEGIAKVNPGEKAVIDEPVWADFSF
ncbi:hypothetical protein T231_00965 [Tannerella sp. oral taxon BU063 isolate Cell 6/7/9]|uniref:VWFA domain-containing protein n=2 Tax=Tannerella serpentiformis TaxID=712710 RepID=W2CVR2_9BACT|nr:hypothetical protein T231_00965 [Tannerella sp. oral taxon BU063 isolate Cell 6/7/9]